MCMSAWMHYLYTTCIQCLNRPEGGIGSPGTGVLDDCQPRHACWKLNPCPLEVQPVLIAIKSSLQPPQCGIFNVFGCCWFSPLLYSPPSPWPLLYLYGPSPQSPFCFPITGLCLYFYLAAPLVVESRGFYILSCSINVQFANIFSKTVSCVFFH